MNLATLTVEGEADLLSELIDDLRLAVDSRWNKGDQLRTGGTHSTSGFCATVADTASPGRLLPEIRAFLEDYERVLEGKDRTRLSGELGVGITVGNSDQYIGSILFGASDMLKLGQLNLTLSVSAYPPSGQVHAGT